MRFVKRSLLAAGGLMLAGFALLGVVGAGSASAAPGDGQPRPYETALAQRLGISVEQLRAAQKSAMSSAIDQAVINGSLTAEQGAKLKSGDFKDGRPAMGQRLGGRLRGVAGNVIDAAAETIGISSDEVKANLKQGKSLAQIAAGRNISRDQLKAGMTANIQADIRTAVANGKLTQPQADKLLANLSTRLDKVIDRTAPPR